MEKKKKIILSRIGWQGENEESKVVTLGGRGPALLVVDGGEQRQLGGRKRDQGAGNWRVSVE
jgi:hypothetical protein